MPNIFVCSNNKKNLNKLNLLFSMMILFSPILECVFFLILFPVKQNLWNPNFPLLNSPLMTIPLVFLFLILLILIINLAGNLKVNLYLILLLLFLISLNLYILFHLLFSCCYMSIICYFQFNM